jgi:hypothetical protein
VKLCDIAIEPGPAQLGDAIIPSKCQRLSEIAIHEEEDSHR